MEQKQQQHEKKCKYPILEEINESNNNVTRIVLFRIIEPKTIFIIIIS